MPDKKIDVKKMKADLKKMKAGLVHIRKIYKKSDDKIDETEKKQLSAIVQSIKAVEAKIEQEEINNTALVNPKLKTPFGLTLDANGVSKTIIKSFPLAEKKWDLPITSPIPVLDFGLTASINAILEFKGEVGVSKGVWSIKGSMSTAVGGSVGGYVTDKLHLVKIVAKISLVASVNKEISLDTKKGFTFIPLDVNVKASTGFSLEEGNTITEWNNYVPDDLKVKFPVTELQLGEIELLFFKISLSTEDISKSTVASYGMGKGAKKIMTKIESAYDSIKKKYNEMVAAIVDFLDLEELEKAIVSYWDSITNGVDYIADKWDQLTDSEYEHKKEIYKKACEAYVKEAMRKDPKLAMIYSRKTKAQKQKYFEEVIAKLPLVKKLHRELFDEDKSDEISDQALNTANALAAQYSIKIINKNKEIAIGEKYQFQVHYMSDREFQADSIDVELMCMGIPVPGLTFSPTAASDAEDAWIDKGIFVETCTASITNELITKVLETRNCDLSDIFFTVSVKVELAGNAKDAFQQIKIPIANYCVDEHKK